MNSYKTFVGLHQNNAPFVLGNIWNVPSAKAFEANGYQAIGISSQAVSNAFGYDDGENLPFELLLQVAQRVIANVNIPFSVDLEGGYSRSAEGIIANISQLHDAGVVGINLEDTVVGKQRQFQSVTNFQQLLSQIANYISQNNLNIFLNIRTDGFLLGRTDALTETLNRIKWYESAGADGIFVPCITNSDDIKAVTGITKLPINVMCMPNLPHFAELQQLGVKRISMGPFLFNKAYAQAGNLAQDIIEQQDFSPLF